MARIPRFEITYDGALVHMMWQCTDKSFFLKAPWAKKALYDLVLENKDRYGVQVYAYCIMDTHPHFIMKIDDKVEFSRFMQKVHSAFALQYNREMNRNGAVVQDRPKTPVIENDEYLLSAMTYLDLNPAKTRRPVHPKDFIWSSYHYYAEGKDDPIIDESPVYTALGETPQARRHAYKKLVDDLILEKTSLDLEAFEYQSCYYGSPDYVIRMWQDLKQRLQERKKRNPPTREFRKPWNAKD